MPKRVELVKLFGGQVSVRLDGLEEALIPRKSECTLRDWERAIEKIVSAVEVEVIEAEKEEWE